MRLIDFQVIIYEIDFRFKSSWVLLIQYQPNCNQRQPNKFLVWPVFMPFTSRNLYLLVDFWFLLLLLFCFELLSIHPCAVFYVLRFEMHFFVCIAISNDDLSLFHSLTGSFAIAERPAGKYNFLFLDISIKISIKWYSVVGLHIIYVCIIFVWSNTKSIYFAWRNK